MKILFVLIPLSLALLGLAVWGFFWMVRNDQFEDIERGAQRAMDDAPPPDQRSK